MIFHEASNCIFGMSESRQPSPGANRVHIVAQASFMGSCQALHFPCRLKRCPETSNQAA